MSDETDTSKPAPRRNLQHATWNLIHWDKDKPAQSLDSIRQALEAEAENAIAWYYQRKGTQSRWSRVLRFVSILLGGLGVVIPLLATARSHGLNEATNAVTAQLEILRFSQWGYILLAIAGISLAVDKLFGFSTCWMRFVDAATKLQSLVVRFRVEWYKEMAASDASGLDKEATGRLFEVLLVFAGKVRGVIESETGEWISEFRTNLTKLEEQTQAQKDALGKQLAEQSVQAQQAAQTRSDKSGAVLVKITNLSSLGTGFQWLLEINNKAVRESISVQDYIAKELAPGPHLVAAQGISNGKVVRASCDVMVETGKLARADLQMQ